MRFCTYTALAGYSSGLKACLSTLPVQKHGTELLPHIYIYILQQYITCEQREKLIARVHVQPLRVRAPKASRVPRWRLEVPNAAINRDLVLRTGFMGQFKDHSNIKLAIRAMECVVKSSEIIPKPCDSALQSRRSREVLEHASQEGLKCKRFSASRTPKACWKK